MAKTFLREQQILWIFGDGVLALVFHFFWKSWSFLETSFQTSMAADTPASFGEKATPALLDPRIHARGG